MKKIKNDSLPLPVGERLIKVVEIAFRARKPVLLEGKTGIGKSEIIFQVAQKLGIAFEVLDLSLLEPPDLVGLPVIEGGRTTYAFPKILPTEGSGILLLEELNRAERYIQQPALQLLTARKLHEYRLPEGWCLCAAINPEDEEYQVTPLDPALRARFLNLLVHADRPSWLSWAQENHVHPAVLSTARTQDKIFQDVPPRTWKYVSDVLYVLRPEDLTDFSLLRDLLNGYLPESWARILLDHLKNCGVDLEVNIYELLKSYHKNPALQKELKKMQKDGKTDRLHQISQCILNVLKGPEFSFLVSKNEFTMEAFESLMMELPGDCKEMIQDAFSGNPISMRLIGLSAEEILKNYKGKTEDRLVASWLRDGKRHRVVALANSISIYLRNHKDLSGLRNNKNALISLGYFIDQVGDEYSENLLETLREINLRPSR